MNKRQLYESIMSNVSELVKKALNEDMQSKEPVYVSELITYLKGVIEEYGDMPIISAAMRDDEWANDDFEDYAELAPAYDVEFGNEDEKVLVITPKEYRTY